MPQQTPEVDRFLQTLDHPLRAQIETLRSVILGADKQITEHVKWNAPSFCYGGDDRITFRLRPADRAQLIFHRGAKVKDTAGFRFEDPSGLLQWVAPDRAAIALKDLADVESARAALKKLVRAWMRATSP